MNDNVVPLPQPQPEPLGVPTLPGRALIGWMQSEAALAAIAGGPNGGQVSPKHRERVARARQAVGARPELAGPVDAIIPDPPGLIPVVDRLRRHPTTQAYLPAGWEVHLVDLGQVCTYQPQVLAEHAEERVAGADTNDTVSLGAITLPTVDSFQLPVKMVQGTFLITSKDHNVLVRQPYAGQPVPGGPLVLGFEVMQQTSLMFVARYQQRYFLCDGNHRAYGFLFRGISRVPAFVRDVDKYEDLNVPLGMLPHDAFLGSRPPFLADYLNDEVAADVLVPASEKLILIQALQLAPPRSHGA